MGDHPIETTPDLDTRILKFLDEMVDEYKIVELEEKAKQLERMRKGTK